jgi:CRP-like cAMP-binding protein
MTSSLGQFISQYVTLSDAEMEDLTGRFRTKLVKKGDHLLRQGDICKDLVFVEKGCLRLYYMQDDIEVSVWFAFQYTSAIEISSFISGQPSNYFIQAIEDSAVLCLPKTEINRLYTSQPKMQEMMRNYWEQKSDTWTC